MTNACHCLKDEFNALCFFLALLVVFPHSSVASEASVESIEARVIQMLGEKATDVLSSDRLTNRQINAEFTNMFARMFDVESVGRYAMGPDWENLSPELRKEYLTLFKSYVSRNYGKRLRIYNGETLELVSVVPQCNDLSVVKTVLVRSGTAPAAKVDWVTKNRDGRVMIVDVVVDGISQSRTQREEVRAILRLNGGDIDALLNALRERT
ncbi:MAG: ABC transporter substrate-binding protein, partial [Alphaproteobacteria bacterium]|nr:ABC transporter substrate-binding protein [Alphaproteobacteria bacterium]